MSLKDVEVIGRAHGSQASTPYTVLDTHSCAQAGLLTSVRNSLHATSLHQGLTCHTLEASVDTCIANRYTNSNKDGYSMTREGVAGRGGCARSTSDALAGRYLSVHSAFAGASAGMAATALPCALGGSAHGPSRAPCCTPGKHPADASSEHQCRHTVTVDS